MGTVVPGDPEASNASSAPGTTVPGTPAEGTLDASTNQSGPNYAFVDVTAEDTMIVQYILKTRMGTRELEDDENDPYSFEVPREEVTKNGRGPLPPRTQIESDIANLKSDKERRKSVNQSSENLKENGLKSPRAVKEESKKNEAEAEETSKTDSDKKEDEGPAAEDKSKKITSDNDTVAEKEEKKDEKVEEKGEK